MGTLRNEKSREKRRALARRQARALKSKSRRRRPVPRVLMMPERLPFVTADGETVLTNVPGSAAAMRTWLGKQKRADQMQLTPGLTMPPALEEGKKP